jgi:nitroreductase
MKKGDVSMFSDRLTMPIGEAIFTQRTIRRFKPDPIAVEDIRTILEAAVKAPNGGNRQPARFLVIDDRALIEEFGKLYHEAWWAKRRDQGWYKPEDIPKEDKVHQSAMRLADEMGNVPVVILACALKAGLASSVLPAVQNLMLAARALGIGSAITTLHPQVDERVHKLLQIPAAVEILVCIPLGYPRGNFGPTTRKPTAETVFFDQWDTPPPWV